MKYTLTVANIDHPEAPWEEVIDRGAWLNSPELAQMDAYDTVEEFNTHLRPGEVKRMVIKVELAGPSDPFCSECGAKMPNGVCTNWRCELSPFHEETEEEEADHELY